MRTITTTVYEFDELDEEARKAAIQNFLGSDDRDDFDFTDMQNSYKEVGDLFDINITMEDNYTHVTGNWEYDHNSDFYTLAYSAEDLIGARAIAWIENRFDFKVLQYEYLSGERRKAKKWALAKSRYEDHLLTGYYNDYCLIAAYKEFKEEMKRNPDLSLYDFFDLLAFQFQKDFNAEIDYHYEDEYVIDLFEANQYEFLEDGTIY